MSHLHWAGIEKRELSVINLSFVVYPVHLNLTDICKEKWPLTSSESLAVTPAMPTFSFSLLTISPFTSNRPIQNVPGIFGWRVSNEIYNLMRIPIDQEVNTSRKGEGSI